MGVINREGALYFATGIDNTGMRRDADESKQIIDSITDAAKKAGAAMGIALGVGTLKNFVGQMFKVRSEFQDTESSMKVFLGSAEKASDFMKKLQDYAWYNMFEFSDLTKESAKLLAFGNDVNSIIPTLDKLSNIASGTKQPLSEFVDLYDKAKNVGKIDAMGLESWATKGVVITDVLKQMGVEVDRSNISFEHLEMVLNKLTSTGGMFSGLMSEQMNNLSASYGQLQDDISIMFNEIGEKSQGMMKGAIDVADNIIKNYEKVGKTILEIAATYGVYRAAIMAVTAVQKISVGTQYAAEIAELSKLIPVKQQSANADIEAAVASGKLTQAKAEELIAIRAEIDFKLESLAANKAFTESVLVEAAMDKKIAADKLVAIEANIVAKRAEITQAKLAGETQIAEKLKKELNTLAIQKNTAAINLNGAVKDQQLAQSKANVAANEYETFSTQVNTASKNANTTSTNILSIAKTKLAAVTARLNAIIMANPYVFVAAAIAGLAYGVYKLVTAETAAEAAQRKHNEALEEARKKKENLISKTNELINKITDETQTIYAQIKAWKELQKEMPEAFGKMTMQEFKNMKPEDRAKLINKTADDKEIKDEEDKIKRLVQYLEKYEERVRSFAKMTNNEIIESNKNLLEMANKLKDDYPETKGLFGLGDGNKLLKERVNILKEEKEQREELIRQGEFDKKPDAEKLSILNDQLQKYRDQYAEIEKLVPESMKFADTMSETVTPSISNVEKGLLSVNTEWGKFDWQTQANIAQLNFLNGKINEVGNTISALTSANGQGITYAQAKADANKAYTDAKKLVDDITKSSKNYSKEAYENAISDLEEKKKAYQALGGDVSDKKKDVNSEIQKRLDAQKRLDEMDRERAMELLRFNLDMRQKDIDSMNDSYIKRFRQLKLNQDKEEQTVKEFEQNKIKEQQKIEEEQWKKNGSKGNFKPTTVNIEQLPEDVKNQAEKMRKANANASKKALDDYNKQMTEALRQQEVMYKSTLDKELSDLDAKYKDEIEKADGNERLITLLKENHAKAREQAIIKNRLSEINFNEELEIEKAKGLESISMVELAEEKKLEIQRKYIKLRIEELKKLAAIGDEDAKKQIAILEENQKNLEIKKPLSLKALGDKAIFDTIKKNFENSGDSAEEAEAKTIKLLSSISKYAGTVANITGELKSAFGGLDEGLDEVLDTVGNIANGFAQGGIIGGISSIISEGINLLNKASEAEKRHQEALREVAKEKLAMQREYNLALLEQNLLLKEATTIFGEKEITKAANTIKVYGDAINSFKQELKGDAPVANFWSTISGDYKKQMDAYNKGIGALYQITTKTGHEKTGLFGWGSGKDIYTPILNQYNDLLTSEGKLNVERAKSILNTQTMSDENKALLQSLIDLQEEADKAQESLRNYLQQTFGSLGQDIMSSIVSAIQDKGVNAWEAFGNAGARVIENLGKQLAYELFFSNKFDKLQKDLEAVYEKTSDPETIAHKQLELVGQFYNQIGNDMDAAQAFMENWQKEAEKRGFNLYNDKDNKQKGVTGELQTQMTEGTGSQLVGLWNMTAMDIRAMKEMMQGYSFPNVEKELNSILYELNAINRNTRDTADNTKDINTHFDKMNGNLEKIEKNTKSNNSRG